MRRLLPVIAALVVLAYAVPSEAQVDDRRWIVQTSDGKLIGFTDDQDVDPPDAAFATFVLESVIRAADPPGATGEILPLGTWIAGVYTAPSGGGIVEHIDPTTDIGEVQTACSAMLDVFDVALAYIHDNRFAWTDDARTKADRGHPLADRELRQGRAERHAHACQTAEVLRGIRCKLAGRHERQCQGVRRCMGGGQQPQQPSRRRIGAGWTRRLTRTRGTRRGHFGNPAS